MAGGLLRVLACPLCTRPSAIESGREREGALEWQGEPPGYKCRRCGRLYGMAHGLPNFLVGEVLPEVARGHGSPAMR